MSKGAVLRTQKRASALNDEDINWRAVEAVDALGVMNPMRQATLELAICHDYEKAAKRAGVTPDVVRGWSEDPLFIAAIGWFVIGLADNHE